MILRHQMLSTEEVIKIKVVELIKIYNFCFAHFSIRLLTQQFKINVLGAQVVAPITNKIKHLIFHKHASGLVVVWVVLSSLWWQ